MKIYLLSKTACAVTINGFFAGTASTNLTCFDLKEKQLFICFYPYDDCLQPVCSFLPRIKQTISQNYAILPFYENYLIIPHFSTKQYGIYKLLKNQKFFKNDTEVNLFYDGFVKIFIKTQIDYDYSYVKDAHINDNIYCDLFDELLFITFNRQNDTQKKLLIYDISDNIKKVYENNVLNYRIKDNIVEITKHTATIENIVIIERYFKKPFKLAEKTTDCDFLPQPLNPLTLPCLFLEKLLSGGSVKNYLCANLAEKDYLLNDYFGDFKFYVPFFKDNAVHAALIYQSYVKTIAFSLKQNTIEDFYFL